MKQTSQILFPPALFIENDWNAIVKLHFQYHFFVRLRQTLLTSFFLYFFISLFLYFFISFFLYFFLSLFLSFFISLFLYFFISLFLYFFLSLFLSFFVSFAPLRFVFLSYTSVLIWFSAPSYRIGISLFYTTMKPGNFSRLNPSLSKLNNWVNQISLERLDIAYNAAVAIKEIEKKHFNSKSISSDVNKGKIINDYFRVQLQRELANVKLNLAQFKLGTFWVNHKLSILRYLLLFMKR